jgi:peptidoglycan/LPS O-acetylase OafA/YrhL
MNQESRSAKFVTLDALRGCAAIFVLTRHTRAFWGSLFFFHSYLGVDLFFILSGFVLSHAYDAKIVRRDLPIRQFVLIRLIRLYPLFFFATVLAILWVVLSGTVLTYEARPWETRDLVTSSILTFLFLPSKVKGFSGLFPLDGPFWSLFFELLVNFLWVIARPILSTRVLVAIAAAAGLFTGAATLHRNGLNLGALWGREQFIEGLCRAIFGFCVGLLLYRAHRSAPRMADRLQLPPLLIILIMLVPLCVPDLGPFNGAIDCLAVFAIFPLVVFMGAYAEPRGSLAGSWLLLGIISYPIYVLHEPAGALIAGVLYAAGVDVARYPVASGILLVLVLSSFCLLLDKIYDKPIRKKLLLSLGR